MSGERKRKVAGMNVGSASLVMVFSVLCLTIFAVLSVVTARSEWNLAVKSAEAVTAYYEADSEAVQILNEVYATYDGIMYMPEHCVGELLLSGGCMTLDYYVTIDSQQELWVQVSDGSGSPQVTRWEVQEIGSWDADQTLNVWSGADPIMMLGLE